jgi:acyl-CoA synthetase (AMP-forming)/AMP-acid ligase II
VFDVDRVLARVAEERITVLPGPPTLYQSLLDHPSRREYDLSSLRVAVTGAADIPVELIRRIDAELPFSTIITGYGLTEGGTAAATGPDDDAETIATTDGRPRPVLVAGHRRIRKRRGRETGELLLRGSVMSHYRRPGRHGSGASPDGWLTTGDTVSSTKRECLRIVGRSKDMYIVGGFNAYPAEIENALLRHPDVSGGGDRHPDVRLGRSAWHSSSPLGRSIGRRADHHVVARSDGGVQGPAGGAGGRLAADQRDGQGRETTCAQVAR